MKGSYFSSLTIFLWIMRQLRFIPCSFQFWFPFILESAITFSKLLL